ncbi:hypothetical protein BSKO_02529 [Bryopsis sp. KO-2023]|nr:hypothetical protein BSKO_02529 [Bryopsis sp. KO-2023]
MSHLLGSKGPFLRAESALDSALGDDHHAVYLLRAHGELNPPVRAVDQVLDTITVLPPGLGRSRGFTLLNQDPAYPYSVPTELLPEKGLVGHLDQIRREVDAMHLKDLRRSSTFQLDRSAKSEAWWTAYEPKVGGGSGSGTEPDEPEP